MNNNNLKWLKKKKTSLTSNSVMFSLWKKYTHKIWLFLQSWSTSISQSINYTWTLSGCSSGSGKSWYVALWLTAQWTHYPPKPVLNVLAQVQSIDFYMLLVNMYYWTVTWTVNALVIIMILNMLVWPLVASFYIQCNHSLRWMTWRYFTSCSVLPILAGGGTAKRNTGCH